ncbi:MAG: alpha/beta fold hydrolase [Syntrophothermus sp.]
MFEGFKLSMVDIGDAVIRVRHGGDGPPVLLLHGHPQTHMMWHKIAPLLARDFTVIAADLRGYGQSSKPASTPDHFPYSKRVMAMDQITLMGYFGFDEFSVVGHDRGGRCAYRMALDHPNRVRRLAVLDIIPTGEAYWRTNMEFAMGYWHWFFLSQPEDFPEKMINANPENYYFRKGREKFDPEALADYLEAVHNPETIHAICEDYRAAATIDTQMDAADRGKQKISCPTLVLWGQQAKLNEWYDVLAIWREWAANVQGHAINCGHYLAEEAPEETYAALHAFLAS